MSWNGSSGVAMPKEPSKTPSPKRGVYAGLFVALGVAAGFYCFIHKNKAKEPTENEPTVVKKSVVSDVKPAIKSNAVAVAEKQVRRTAKGTIIPDRVQPDKYGVLRYPGGMRWVDTNNLDIVKHPRPKRLFKRQSENAIALLLTLDPDKMCPFLVGRRPKFNQRFVEDFKVSLNEPEEYPETDTEEEREVRKMVYQTKKDMADALNRGEDIAKMMNDAQDELDRMVAYKDTLMKQLREIKDAEKYSDDDVKDFITAANEMLKKEGLKELAMPNLTYRQTRLARLRERKLKESQSEGTNNE